MENWQELAKSEYGVALSAAQAEQFDVFLRELLDKVQPDCHPRG